MPDKTLTDSEITIKALKELLAVTLSEGDLQKTSTISHAINLINRQQNELDILSQKRFNIFERVEYIGKIKAEIKTEAYKECIEKVKEKYQIFENQTYAINPYALHKFLDNLLKEKVGENNVY